MSRAKRRALQNVPDISFQGDSLDRLLGGALTEGVVNEIRKTLPQSKFKPQPEVLIGSIIPARPYTNCIVMQCSACECGNETVTFGYFAQMFEDDNGRRFKFVERMYERPTAVMYEARKTPFCGDCLDSGLRKL